MHEPWAFETSPGVWTYSREPERLISQAMRLPSGSDGRRRLMSEAWATLARHASEAAEYALAKAYAEARGRSCPTPADIEAVRRRGSPPRRGLLARLGLRRGRSAPTA